MKEVQDLLNASNRLLVTLRETEKGSDFENQNLKVIIGTYLSIVSKIDNIVFLCNNERYVGVETLLRSAFESLIILKFILEKDTDKRIRSYQLSNKVKFINMVNTAIEDSPKGKRVRGYLQRNQNFFREWLEKIEDRKEVLEEFKTLTGKQKADKWFNVEFGLESLEKVCGYLGDEWAGKYEILYRVLSQEAHGKNSEDILYYDKEHQSESVLLPFIKVIALEVMLDSMNEMSLYFWGEKLYK